MKFYETQSALIYPKKNVLIVNAKPIRVLIWILTLGRFGKLFEYQEDLKLPPRHYNCRSTLNTEV
jgi:hypothetical protein